MKFKINPKYKSKFFLSTLVSFGILNIEAQPIFKKAQKSCLAALTRQGAHNAKTFENVWRPNPRNTLMALRSNVPHYWTWSKEYAQELFSADVVQLLEAHGVVMGDVHNKNFGFVWRDGFVSKVRVVDLDDGGMGPFLLDIANYIHRIRLAAPEVKISQVWKAYVNGALDIHQELPKEVKDLISADTNEIEDELVDKTLKFVTAKNKFNYKKKKDLTPLTDVKHVFGVEAGSEYLQVFEQDSSALEGTLVRDGYEILDIALRVKASGGSQGLPRFVYLVKKDEDLEVISFKQQGEPSTQLYTEQKPHYARFLDLVKFYWPSVKVTNLEEYDGVQVATAGQFKMIQNGDRAYLRFVKAASFLEYKDEPKTKAEYALFSRMTFYKANFLGLSHGKQESFAPIREFLKKEGGREQLLVEIKSFIATYNDVVEGLRKEEVVPKTDSKKKKKK